MNKILIILLSFTLVGCLNLPAKKNSTIKADLKVMQTQNIIEEDSAESLLKKAKILEQENNYSDLLGVYKKLCKLMPDSLNIKIKLADFYRLTGKTIEAKELYSELLQHESISSNQESEDYLHILEAVGMCLIQDGDLNGAIETLSAIFEIDAMRWRTINALGVAYALSGNHAESEKYFKLSLALEENQYIVYNNMALASAFNGRYEDAIKYQKQAIEFVSRKNANFERLEMNLALLFGLSGKMDAAEEILRKYLSDEKVKNNLKYYSGLYKNSDASKKLLKKSLGAVNSNS
jgi:Flp pilus assembly protein TadD